MKTSCHTGNNYSVSVSVCLQIISKTMKLRYKLILMNLMNESLNNRSMNLQLGPSPTI